MSNGVIPGEMEGRPACDLQALCIHPLDQSRNALPDTYAHGAQGIALAIIL